MSWRPELQATLPAAALALDRASGEHGIGLDKLAFVKDALDPGALSLMRAIQAQFDPHGILNPGKVLP